MLHLLSARWPAKLLATDDVNVQVVDGLAAMSAIVGDKSVSLRQPLLFGNQLAGVHHLTKDLIGLDYRTEC